MLLTSVSTLTKISLRAVKAGQKGHQKRQDRLFLCKDIEGNTVNQKLENEQNYVRDDIGETRVVVEMAVTSLVVQQANHVLQSCLACANST